MPVFKYDTDTRQMVKVSDRIPLRGEDGRSFDQKIMDGYRRVEAKGERINGRATGIKRIWGKN